MLQGMPCKHRIASRERDPFVCGRLPRPSPSPPLTLMPWHRCTPALPKPIPARVAARVTAALASSSARSLTLAMKCWLSRRRACMDHTSLMGLAPW